MADQDGSRCGVEFEKVFARELDYVQDRWQTAYDENEREVTSTSKPTTANNLVGLAFSGGGIRSATINMGITQSLHQRGVFDHVDYLSTVSGGGYVGSSISTAMRRLPDDPPEDADEEEKHQFSRGKGEFPFSVDFTKRSRRKDETCEDGIESPFLTWVRNNSNYMATGGFLDFARMGGVLLRGILVNFLILLPILLFLAAVLFWRYDGELDKWKQTAKAAATAQQEATEAEAKAARLADLSQEADCGADMTCVQRAVAAESAAKAADEAAERARLTVPTKGSFFPVAPILAGVFVALALIFPVLIRIYKVYQHRKQQETGEESSVGSRSMVEMVFAYSLTAIGVVAIIESLPILIHYFHHLRDAGWRGASAGVASGAALAAITAAGKVMSSLGGLKQKLILLAVGMLGLVIPLVVMLYVTEGLVYGSWGAIHTFDLLHPLRAPAEGAAKAALWLVPGALLIILGGGTGSWVVGRLSKGPSKGRAAATWIGILAGGLLGYCTINWLSWLLALISAKTALILAKIPGALENLSGGNENLWSWILAKIPGGLEHLSGGPENIWPVAFVLGSAAVVVLFCYLAVDVNLTGVLGLYRDRLASAYLIGVRKTRDGDGKLERLNGKLTYAEEVFVEPDLDLENMCGGTPPDKPEDPKAQEEWRKKWQGKVTRWRSKAPYHIVNTTLNLQGSTDPLIRDRNSDFMMFSKYYYGGDRTGYCKTGHLEKVFPQMDLPTAMAISAAAASPNSGKVTNKPLVALMTLFNVRLGYWVPHPGRLCEWLREKDLKEPQLYHRWGWRIPPRALLREMTSAVNEDQRWINLSDGGHLENLAVYELLRRRCRYIICGDGEADPNLTFNGLATLMRFARIDMGIEIEILLDDLRLGDDRLSSQHSALGRVIYPGQHPQVRQAAGGQCPEPGCQKKLKEDPEAEENRRYFCPAGKPEIGYLLYIKSSFTGNEDETMQEYRANKAEFPHESTADQFFDEGQFEAYRALGYHMADGLFPPIVGGKDPRQDWTAFTTWFENLRADLAPRLSTKHADLQDQLRRIQKALVRKEYREYYFELHPNLKEGGGSTAAADDEGTLTPEITYMVGQQLALMENAFVNLNLDQPRNWNHEGNQGWKTLFEKWARSKRFAKAYEHLGHLHSGRFQNFCHRAFGLPDAAKLWQIMREESAATAAAAGDQAS